MGKGYNCKICNKRSQQKSHHEAHLATEGHKDKRIIQKLQLEKEMNEPEKIEEKLKEMENELPNYSINNKEIDGKIVWEIDDNNIVKHNRDISEKIISIIDSVHNNLYNEGIVASKAEADIVKIVSLLLISHLYNKNNEKLINKINEIEDLSEIEKNKYLSYCKDITELSNQTNIHNEWSRLNKNFLNKINPRLFNNKDKDLNCKDNNCLKIIIIKINSFSKLIWDTDNNPLNNYSNLTGDIHEYFKNKYGGSGKELGQFFTPLKLIICILEGLDVIGYIKKSNMKIYDPCMGSGGFLINSYKYLNDLKMNDLYGGEKDIDTIKWAFNSFLLSFNDIVNEDNIKLGDSIQDINDTKCNSITNPPFNIKMKYNEEKIKFSNENYNFKDIYPFETNSPEALFIQLCHYKLGENNISSIVLPYGSLFESPQNRFAEFRKWLLDNSDILKILIIPRGVFDFANVLTCNIVFRRKTEEENVIQYLKTNKDCSKIYKLFEIPQNEIINNNNGWCNYSLSHYDYMNLNINKNIVNSAKNHKCMKLRDIFTITRSDIPSGDIANVINGPYKFITGAKDEDWKNIDSYDYDDEAIFIGCGGNGDSAPVKYFNGKYRYSNLMGKIVIKEDYRDKVVCKYLYYVLYQNQRYIEEYSQRGQSQRSLHIDRFMDIDIYIPSYEEQNDIMSSINKTNIKIEALRSKIKNLDYKNRSRIKKMFESNDIIDY